MKSQVNSGNKIFFFNYKLFLHGRKPDEKPNTGNVYRQMADYSDQFQPPGVGGWGGGSTWQTFFLQIGRTLKLN